MKKGIFLFLSFIASSLGAFQNFYPYMDEEVNALKQHVLSQLPYFHGWCTKEKASEFIDLVLIERPSVWVEIGVFGGSSLFPVASAFKFLGQGKVIGIDPWDKIECIKYYDPIKDKVDLKWWGNLDLNYIFTHYLSQFQSYGLEPYCTTIRETSQKAIEWIDAIDVLYIDGNHSEKASLLDAQLYFPKVRSGGFIWVNDSTWEERQAALEYLYERCDLVKMIDNGNCILFKKRVQHVQ